MMKEAEAAAAAAIANGASVHDVAQAAGNAVKAAGGTQADIIKAVANAAMVAYPKKAREEMTDSIFKDWDLDNSGTLEFEEILPKYMKATNHTDHDEAKVRGGFERFMQNQGKKASDSMDRMIFGKWMGRATLQQVTFQYLRLKESQAEAKAVADVAVQAVKATGATAEEVASTASQVAVSLGKSKEEAEAAAAAEAKKAAAKKKAEEEEAKSLKVQEKYESIFDKIDTAKKGVLTLKDLEGYFAKMDPAARKELGVTKIDEFMKEADVDGDGQIERDEFALYFTYANLDKEACYNAIFDAIDFDGDGQLTMEEVRDYDSEETADLFRLLAIPNWHSIVSKMDTDGDGEISREEFMTYMMGRLDKVSETKAAIPQKPAWKQAAKMPGKRKQGDDFNKCWDFVKGYCYRGARCHYEHAEEDKVDQSVLDEHLKVCREAAKGAGVHLNMTAMNELQTLTVTDATKLINSLGFGGEHEGVWDKNSFVIHKARHLRMQAGAKEHPDWEWYHGSNKRQRIA